MKLLLTMACQIGLLVQRSCCQCRGSVLWIMAQAALCPTSCLA